MRKRLFGCWCFLVLFDCSRAQIPSIGGWREHLSYHQATSVASTTTAIFCATPYSLFSVDLNDNTINRYNKITGLHEVGIQKIKWDAQTGKLLIAYNNSNIDMLVGNQVFNIRWRGARINGTYINSRDYNIRKFFFR